VRGRALGLGPQGLHGGGRVIGAVDGGAGHEHVRARLGAPLDGLLVDAAVDLEPYLGTALGHQGASPA
jgi:hypothetical protein